jgi:hypothetical protein
MYTDDNDLDIEDVVLAKIEAGQLAEADAILDSEIQKLATDIARIEKRNKQAAEADTTDTEDQLDEGIDEDEESTPPPAAKKALEAAEAKAVMAKARDVLDTDTDDLVRVTKALSASGNHTLREQAARATFDDLQKDLAKLGTPNGTGEYTPNRVPHPPIYPHSESEWLESNRVVRPSSTETFPDRSQRTVVPAVQPAGQHAFEAIVDQLVAQNGGSRSAAFTAARLLHPSAYVDYNAWRSSTSAQSQRAGQASTNNEVNKSAPIYEQLLAAEIRKGFSPHVAQQRIANSYGLMPDGDEAIAKADDAYADLREAAQELLVESDAMPRTTAMRKARLANESIYKRLV